MTGPFNPNDFEKLIREPGEANMKRLAATIANAIDAKRWACERGGEHEPVSAMGNAVECRKCLKSLRDRWEAV